jgi:chain length determinant protein EpsF
MNYEQLIKVLYERRKLMIKVFGSVVVLTAVLILLVPAHWTAKTVLAVDEKASDPVTGMPVAAYLIPGYLQTQVEIVTSHSTALKVVDMLGLDKQPDVQKSFVQDTDGSGSVRDWLADQLQKKVDVQPGRESSLISISYTTDDPKSSAALANAFAQAYMGVLVDIQTSAAQQQNLVFQQQLVPLRENLARAQQRLAVFQQKSGIVYDGVQHFDMEAARLNDMGTQLVAAQSAAVDARARAGGNDLAPDVQNNLMIQQQKALLAQSDVKLHSIAQNLGPNNPQYQQALAERNANQQQLAAMTREYVSSLKQGAANSATRQSGLQGAVAKEKSAVLDQKQQAAQMDALQKDVEDAQRAYSQVLARFSDTSLASHVSQTATYVLETANEPSRPSWPRPLLSLMAALCVGGLLAVGCAFLAELLDRRVHVREDVEKLLDLQVLALVEYADLQEPGRLNQFVTRLKGLKGVRAS